MQKLEGYTNIDKIYESTCSLVFRAFEEKNKRPVVLKVFNTKYPAPEEITRFNQEYEITRRFMEMGVIRAYEISIINNLHTIIMEDIGGRSLADILKSKKLQPDEFLRLAVCIAEIIGNIHKQNIIHKDINPSNIIWNTEKDIVRIIDFGIATELSREITSVKNPNILEGTLSFISPEQTGRMNRSLDYRTDFYSLGVTFYWMLTGRLPFESKDLLKLVHSHIAIQPVPPHEIDESIPEGVSHIVMKLMAKNAEDRYLSAHGLKSDLEHCRQDLQDTGTISTFELGKHDVSEKFQIPQKLYGREQEIETLLSAFERVRETNTELMLVFGFSGIGKSVLINEIQKPIVKYNGYFISGKFEKLKKDMPYSALIQAFTGFARQILSEGDAKINRWKNKILPVLGPNGKIVTDVIPLFELILGKQQELPTLGPVESQNRFNLVFQGFVEILAAKEHPLVVFLDDLQWADAASLHLIKLFTSDPDIKHLFMIGAYRHNETPGSHPLILTLDEIKKSGVIINTIFLQPLNAEHINHLLGDTLNSPAKETNSLTTLLIQKTGGNPFFVNEFLKSLYKKSLIEFSFEHGWSWNKPGIKDMQATDNVVNLMADKITDLSENSQNVLKLGACIGSSFNLSTLATVSEKPEKNILTALNEILQEGMLNKRDKTYEFSHDRVQEAAYSLIPDEEKTKRHYRIGNLELQNTKKKQLPDKIFYIVNQLNAGINLVTEESEQQGLARLNLMAGEKALVSNAYESSLNYLKTGIGLLKKNCWQEDYDFTLKLYVEAVCAAQLSADYETMDTYAEVVFNNAVTILDQIKVYETKIFACAAQNLPLEGVRIGLGVLKRLRIRLPEKPGKLRIVYSLLLLKLTLLGKPVDNLINLPEMKNPHKLAAMRILSGIGSSVYIAAPELFPLAVFTTIRLSVKYGNSIYSPYFYAAFGLVNCAVIGDINTGYEYGKLALDLVEKLQVKETRARVWVIVYFFINHWKRALRDSVKVLLEAYKTGLETGDLEFAAFSANMYSLNLFFPGIDLAVVEKEMKKYTEMIEKINQGTILNYQRILYQAVLNLRGKSLNPYSLIGSSYDETKMLAVHQKANDRTAIFIMYYYLLYLNFLFERNEEALNSAELGRVHLDTQISQAGIPIFHFYDSLARLALKKDLTTVRKNQVKMKKWAFHAPANHSHKYHLVEAEIARVLGQDLKAEKHYDLAVTLARKNKFLNEEALSLELIAKFWLERNKDIIAAAYMTKARHTYRMWGAVAKVNHIKEKYRYLLALHVEGTDSYLKTSTISAAASSTTNYSEALDLSTVIKTSEILSGEIDLGKLLETILKLSIENAGAERGFFIIENEENKNLYIEAEGAVDKKITVLESIPIEKNTGLCSAIIRFVNRTGENIVLNNASIEGNFIDDPYIIENKIKSLLCTPITHKGKISGIVYLENNITANVFTPGRLELLRIVSSQAAISIENARLLIHRENEAKLGKEIEMAERIQRSLLPKKIPEIKEALLAFKYIPRMGVGGDFVNLYYKEEANKLGLFICDVSGHGVPAAMTASMVSNSLDFFWDTHFDSPSKILKEMGNSLKDKMGGNFFTGCICSIDLTEGSVIMSNAGHPPLLIIRKNGSIEMKGTKGRLIDDFFEPNSENVTLELQHGDMLVLYTDGITEAEDPDGEMIGVDDDKFSRWIKKYYDMSSSPEELCENIYKGVIEYTRNDQLEDDFTVLVMEYLA
ncbi:MAG: AAA family ATPase [bacterium]|nr:AAA family ATPase [bacterium]